MCGHRRTGTFPSRSKYHKTSRRLRKDVFTANHEQDLLVSFSVKNLEKASFSAARHTDIKATRCADVGLFLSP